MKKVFLIFALFFAVLGCSKAVRATMTGYVEVTETGQVYFIVVGADGRAGEEILLDTALAKEINKYPGYLLELEYTPAGGARKDLSFKSIVR